jgi:hypothetical protein
LTKADVFYYVSNAIVPSAWFNVGTRILLDRTGNLAAVVDASKALKFAAPAASILTHIEKCVAGLIEGAKRMRRDETRRSMHLVSALKLSITFSLRMISYKVAPPLAVPNVNVWLLGS